MFLAYGPPEYGHGLSAVKRLRPEAQRDPTFIDMFLDEARLARLLDHPNICRVYDVGRWRGSYYFAMEWVDGVSLAALLREGPLAEATVATILDGLLSALAYAHGLSNPRTGELGVIHRDVSPSNVFVGIDGRVKLLDFGLARARTQFAKTDPAFIKAKLGYLAPEQITGVIDHRVDLFALGVCAFEALTGKNPFSRSSASGALHAFDSYSAAPSVRAERPAVSDQLAAVVEKLLAPKPADRYPDAAAALDALRAACPRASRSDLANMVATLFPDLHPTPPPEGRPGRPDLKRQAVEEVDGVDRDPETFPFFLILLAAGGVVLLALAAWAVFS